MSTGGQSAAVKPTPHRRRQGHTEAVSGFASAFDPGVSGFPWPVQQGPIKHREPSPNASQLVCGQDEDDFAPAEVITLDKWWMPQQRPLRHRIWVPLPYTPYTQETPAVVLPRKFRLFASRQTSLILPARRTASFLFGVNPIMSIPSNFSFFRGEDVVLDFQLSPVEDITGWTLSLKVADTLGGSVQFTKSPTITDGPRGKFRTTIASADTASLTAGRYTWDVRRTDSGSKATLAHGEINLLREVTA